MNNKCMRLATSGAMSLVLGACATAPVPSAEAKPAPADRVSAYQTVDAGHGRLTVTRDNGFIGSGCMYAVHINQLLAARLETGETATFGVPPGDVLLRVGRDPLGRGLCGGDQGNWVQRETTLKSGEAKRFRLSLDSNGKPDVSRADD